MKKKTRKPLVATWYAVCHSDGRWIAEIPQLTLALDSSMVSYRAGSLDFLSLLTNFLNMLEQEMNYYEEFASFHQALARLEESTGRHLTD
mgnify:CR=1 FL=1